MSDEAVLRVGIDGTGAQTGSRTVVRSLEDISGASSRMGSSVTQAQGTLNLLGGAANLVKGALIGMVAGFSMGAVISQVREAISVLDEFKTQTIQTAAQIASIRGGGAAKGGMVEVFESSFKYAEALNMKMEEIDARSFANASTLKVISDQYTMQQNKFLDIGNEKQVRGFEAIANAVMTISKGLGAQTMTEARALFEGRAGPGSTLAIQVESLIKQEGKFKSLKEAYEAWTAEGKNVIEEVGKRLEAYAVAGDKISNTLQAVSSSWDTIYKKLQRDSVAVVYDDLVKLGKWWNEYIKTNSETIADRLNATYLFFKGIAESVVLVVQPIWDGLSLAVNGIIGGIAHILTGLESTTASSMTWWDVVKMIFEGIGLIGAVALPVVLEKVGNIFEMFKGIVQMVLLLVKTLIDGFIIAGKSALGLGLTLAKALTGDLEGARKEFQETFSKDLMKGMVENGDTFKGIVIAMKENWNAMTDLSSFDRRMAEWKNVKAKIETPTTPDAPNVKMLTDAEKKALDERTKAAKAARAEMDRLNASMGNDMVEAHYRFLDSQLAAKESLEEYIVSIGRETEMLVMSDEQRIIHTKLLALEKLGIAETSEEWKKYAAQIEEALKNKKMAEDAANMGPPRELYEQQVRDRLAADKELQERYKVDWTGIFDQVGQSLTDALMKGGLSAKDYLEDLFRTMILRPMLQPIMNYAQDAIKGVIGNLFNAITGAGGSAGGSAFSWASIISPVTNAYGILANSATTLGATVTSAAESIGTYMATYSGSIGSAGTSISGAASSLGSIATGLSSVAGWAGLWLWAGKTLQGDYAFNEGGDRGIGGFLGAKTGIKGPIGGLITRMFGHKPFKPDGAWLEGEWSTEDLSKKMRIVEKYEAKGGWFSSTKHKYLVTKMSEEQDKYFDDRIKGIIKAMEDIGSVFSLSTDGLFDYKEKIKIAIKRGVLTDPAAMQAVVDKAFKGFSKGLAEAVFGAEVEPYLRTVTNTKTDSKGKEITKTRDENTLEALQRLSNAIVAVNSGFDLLSLAMYQSTLAGANMAQELIDLFGDAGTMQQMMGNYYSEYYTAEEQRLNAIRMGTEQYMATFGALNAMFTDDALITVPQTREQFRALVESLDLTTERGQALFRGLMGIAPVFDTVLDAAEQAATSILNAWIQLVADLKKTIEDLLGGPNSILSPEQKLAMAKEAWDRDLALSKGGDTEAAGRLSGRANTYVDVARDYYASSTQYADIFTEVISGLEAVVAFGSQLAGLPAYAVGSSYIDRDQIARIHQGEMVIDKSSADALRSYGIRVSGGDGVSNGSQETLGLFKTQIRVLQEGFLRLIEIQKEMAENMAEQNRTLKLERRAS